MHFHKEGKCYRYRHKLFLFGLVVEESAMVMGQNEGGMQSERKLPGAPDEGEIIKKRKGEGDFQMQEEKKKKKKRNNGQDKMARSEGEENEGHQANWRWIEFYVGMEREGRCRRREKMQPSAGRLEGARSDFGAECCKERATG